MRSRREAESRIRADREGLETLRKAISRAREAVHRAGNALPEVKRPESLEGLTRLVFLSTPAIFEESREIRKAAADILGRAFGIETEMLLHPGPWDCHVSTTTGFFLPELYGDEFFSILRRDGGKALFLAGGIGQEALEFLSMMKLEPENMHIRVSILEKDHRYALAARMRGLKLLFDRPASLDEYWGPRAHPSDLVFLSFPPSGLDFRRIAVQIDTALRKGGTAILMGNLDFAGEATSYFLGASYLQLANPMRGDREIDKEHLQIYRKL